MNRGSELPREYGLWCVGGLKFESRPTSVSGACKISEVNSSGVGRSKYSSDPMSDSKFGGHEVPSEGRVSGSRGSETRTYLVLNIGREVSSARYSMTATRWVIGG